MIRTGLFWKILLPVAGILAAAMLIVAGGFAWELTLVLSALLAIAAVWHARWMFRVIQRMLSSVAERVEQWPIDASKSGGEQGLLREFPQLSRRIEQAGGQISERMRLLESRVSENAESTELLQAVLRTMVEGVIVVDRDEQVLFTNKAARSLMDFETREVLSRPLWEVSRTPAIHEVVKQVLEDRQQRQAEVVMPRTRAVISLTVAALPRDPVPGAVLVLHDVTNLRRLESLRRDFVTNVSHELKTPLTSIQAYADTLLEGGADDSEQAELFLTKIVDESERLHQIILDVIRLGKIESHQDVFRVERVQVAAVVSACLELHAAVAESRHVLLVNEPPAEPVVVSADTEELRTMLDNLVDNALNYTEAGGTVCVRWYAEQEWGVMEVQDDGQGIPREQQSRVFERFFRVDRARDRQRGGTGLGLSIVKHLCQMFGGTVEVESEMGQGSLFRIRLPLRRNDLPSAPNTGEHSESSLVTSRETSGS